MADQTASLLLKVIDDVTRPSKNIHKGMDLLKKDMASLKSVNLGSMSSFGKASQTAMANMRTMMAGNRAAIAEMAAMAARFAAPAAIGIAAKESYAAFADTERQLSRTGIKLGATREEMEALRAESVRLAQSYAVPVEQVLNILDTLAESGFSLDEAKASLDGMVKSTQGLGGAGSDTVSTFDAARKSIGLATRDAEKFFDQIAAGGAAGKFEGSDLARYLPSLLPVVSKMGYEGLEGSSRLIGFLEVMRDFVGTSEEAAGSTGDLFEKMVSPDVIKNFAKLGVNIERRLGKTRDAGGDVLETLHEILSSLAKADPNVLGKIFGDKEARRAANVVLTQMDRVREKQDAILNGSKGTIGKNVERVLADNRAAIDRMSTAWENLKNSFGGGIAPGATAGLEKARAVVDEIAGELDGLKARVDISEIRAARDAVGEVSSAIGVMMNLGGDQTVIGKFFDRIVQAAETTSAAINVAKDAAQALGLVAPDNDTDVQKQRRRDRLVDGVFDGPLGKAPKAVYDAATHRETGDTFRQMREGQDKAIEDTARTRGVSVATVRAEIEAAARRRAERTGKPFRSPFQEAPRLPALNYPTAPPPDLVRKIATPTPAPRMQVNPAGPALKAAPIPTPRPMDLAALAADGERAVAIAGNAAKGIAAALDAAKVFEPRIAAPVEAEGAKAIAVAATSAAQMAAALSFIAKPTIDLSSINGAMGAVSALSSMMRSLPDTRAAIGQIPPRPVKEDMSSIMQGPPLPRRAAGGLVRGSKDYLVGEKGPEVLRMGSQSGNVVPNHRTGGNVTNNYFNIKSSNPQGVVNEIMRRMGRQVSRSADSGMDGRWDY